MTEKRYRVEWGRWSFEDYFADADEMKQAIQEAADEIESAVNIGVADIHVKPLGFRVWAEVDVGKEHQEVFLTDDGVDLEPEMPMEFVSDCPVGFTEEGAHAYVESMKRLHPTVDFRVDA